MLVFLVVWAMLWLLLCYWYKKLEKGLRAKGHVREPYFRVPAWSQYAFLFFLYLCLPFVIAESFWMTILYALMMIGGAYNLYCARWVKETIKDLDHIDSVVEEWKSSK